LAKDSKKKVAIFLNSECSAGLTAGAGSALANLVHDHFRAVAENPVTAAVRRKQTRTHDTRKKYSGRKEKSRLTYAN
jgi:hypothetical protein